MTERTMVYQLRRRAENTGHSADSHLMDKAAKRLDALEASHKALLAAAERGVQYVLLARQDAVNDSRLSATTKQMPFDDLVSIQAAIAEACKL